MKQNFRLTSIKFLLSLALICLASSNVRTQTLEVYPSHWWVHMKWNTVQLLAYSKTSFSNPGFTVNYPGVILEKSEVLENPNYATLTLRIEDKAAPGQVEIGWMQGKKKLKFLWTLKARREGNGKSYAQGLNPSDLIYLIIPDRFSNGDPSNDHVKGMRDQSLNRDSIYYRHGGDLQGVINHLDYLQSLGVTSLWPLPVLENDMPNRTEHGYAITNHYKVDPRLGGDDAYKRLSDELHKRGMKLIQDGVYNHVGLYHHLVQNKPVKDWLHEWPTYTNTNWRDATQFDLHVAASEKKLMTNGWFTREMPDLNQENPIQSNFLIQNAIWCVEEFGVDAWRIDTYPYNNMEFMNHCNKALLDEYPSLFMFGEAMVHAPVNQAFYTENTMNIPFKSNLPSVVDFQGIFHGITPALENPNEGLNQLYMLYSNDLLYKDANRLVTMLDNHDINRFFTQVGEDVSKLKIGMGWLLTGRGIPQLYYGSEVLMKGSTSPRDGHVRLDFPGGWEGDQKNAFTQHGLTSDEKGVQDFVRTLGNFRKQSSALQTGKMMQYAPKEGCYVYFRYDDKQTIMVVMNAGSKSHRIMLSNYEDATKNFKAGKNVVTGEAVSNAFDVEPKTITILELN